MESALGIPFEFRKRMDCATDKNIKKQFLMQDKILLIIELT